VLIYGIAYLAAWMAIPNGAMHLRQFLALLNELRN